MTRGYAARGARICLQVNLLGLMLGACARPLPPPRVTVSTALPTLHVSVSVATPTPIISSPTVPPTLAPQAVATTVTLFQNASNPNFRLSIPAIGVASGITTLGWHTEDVNGQKLAVWDDPGAAVGYVVSSAPPGGVGNTVMLGHNNIDGAVFKHLSELSAGARIEVWLDGTLAAYSVSEVLILEEANASPEQRAANLRYLDPTTDIRLTLVSCWPENGNSHRVIVIAYPTP